MRSRDPMIRSDQRQDGNILGRRNREVIKDATIGGFALFASFI
jgi:hypothetical protein